MIPVQLSQLATVLDARLMGADATVSAVVTDSRQITPGCLFVVLRGERFDAHDFVPQACAAGAAAAVVERYLPDVSVPQLVVKEGRRALGQLGAWVKTQVSPKTVAVTGSAGKTTVKEMLAAICATAGQTLATRGNYNNDIGVPLTLLRLTPDDQYAVIEMGANHRGEIAYTTHLTQPQASIITNAAAAHLEGFGDLWGVARAKGEIMLGLGEGGVAIFPADAPFTEYWLQRAAAHQAWTFAVECPTAVFNARQVVIGADGCASFELVCPQGMTDIRLALPGRHNVNNALAATAAALALGISLDGVKRGLAEVKPVKGRLNAEEVIPGVRLIDDTYNANLQSVKAAIDLLAGYAGTRVLILGDMAELGSDARRYHAEVGQYAAEKGLNLMLTCGELSRHAADAAHGEHFTSQSELVAAITPRLKTLPHPLTVLVKGSRSAAMEKVVAAISLSLKPAVEESPCSCG